MRLRISPLDFKLGIRMMARYPGLSLTGILAMAVAIGLGAAWFEVTRDMFDPSLPLDEGERIVSIRNWDAAKAAPEPRTLHDFLTWREELRSVEDLGAASVMEYTVTAEDGRSAAVPGARITASAFRVARVPPLLGRSLLEEDGREGSPPVAVISHGLWRRLFDGDRDAIGRTVRLGTEIATVVGVMPEGFGFPLNQEVWVPFRANPLQYDRRAGPANLVFGRLAPGFTLAEAQAELTSLGQRAAAEFPETNRQLRPRVEGYLDALVGGSALVLSALNAPLLVLLLVICATVATLVFARTVTREGELVTRSALGASRGRLVVQLFAEALVLTSAAAALGLAVAGLGLKRGMDLFWEVQASRPPFWFDSSLSSATVLYTAALAVLGAALVGAVPALKATGRNLRPGLTLAAGGGSRLRFGAASTAVIVVQVALCVIFLPIAAARSYDALGGRVRSVGFPADEYLTGRLTSRAELPQGAPEERTARLQEETRRRLAAEPGVTAVAFASRLPGMNHPYERVRVEGRAGSAGSGIESPARSLSVDPDFFEVMGARIVAGRGFGPADLESAAGVAVVDRTFVRDYLEGRNPVGLRLRYPGRPEEEGERWYEVVGVVEDLAMNAYGPGGYQDLVQLEPAGYVGVYHPLRPGEAASVQMFLRTDSPNPDALAARLASTVTSLDPALEVEDLATLEATWRPAHRGERLLTWMIALVVAVVVGLSAAGIYALVSFTVTQRTREIGIRTALGADPRRIIVTIFSRALAQIGLGVLVGGVVFALAAGIDTPRGVGMAVATAAAMMGVGLLACVLPAARALRIEPTEALRADA